MKFASKNARSTAAIPDRAAPVADIAGAPAALAVAELAQPATHQLDGLDRFRTICNVRPSVEAVEACAAQAGRAVQAAMLAYNANRSITAEMARKLADIATCRHLAGMPAAGVLQREIWL